MTRWLYTAQFCHQTLTSYIHICMTDHQQYSSHRSYIIRQYLQNWTQLELTGGALKHKETTYYSYKQQSCTRMLLTFCSIPNLCKICSAAEWCRTCWMLYYVAGRKVPDVSKKSSNPRKILGLLDLCSWRHYSAFLQTNVSYSPKDGIISKRTRVIT
jgi:hypothetical protein